MRNLQEAINKIRATVVLLNGSSVPNTDIAMIKANNLLQGLEQLKNHVERQQSNERCRICRGGKHYVGEGGMIHKCECIGGWIPDSEKPKNPPKKR